MSEVRQQLLITLVHGTWPRGLFPRIVRFKHWVRALVRRQPRGPLIFWFEEGSPFLARLGTELGDVPHKITPLLWSGANSIFVRDKTAQVLAEHLSGEHAQHPQATQLVIAHSHGGNIALRALHHLKQGKASPSCVESVNPLVVTLGTPFMEVHPADFGRRPFYIRVALTIFVMGPILFLLLGLLGWFLSLIFVPLEPLLPVLVAGTPFLVLIMGRWWVVWRAPARQNQLVALEDATRLSGLWSTQRLLVIRAIDDEASLTLSLGAMLNYLAARSIAVVLLFYLVLAFSVRTARLMGLLPWLPKWPLVFVLLGCFPLTIILFGLLFLGRSWYGRELAVSPLECQINIHSTPDATSPSKIVTLVRRTFARSLRHGIYDHEDCAKVIADWVRSQLTARGQEVENRNAL